VPTFHWKGVTGGHVIEGDLDAHSKEEVMQRLRAQRITVSSVTEGKSSGEPIDPDLRPKPSLAMPEAAPRSLSEELERGRKQPRHPFRGLLVVLGLIAVAIAVGAMAPIVFCKCERTNGQVVCTINDRILGVVPVRNQTLAGVVSVDTQTEFWKERRSTTSTIERARVRIVLHDAHGATIRPFGWDQGGTLGATSATMREDIDQFLSDANAKSVVFWQGQWVPLLMPVILLLLAALMLILVFVSLNDGLTNRFYDAVGRLAEKSDRRRKLHHP